MEYEHSSAAFYMKGAEGNFPVKDYEYLLADLYYGKEEDTESDESLQIRNKV